MAVTSPFIMFFTRPITEPGISGVKVGPICSALALDYSSC